MITRRYVEGYWEGERLGSRAATRGVPQGSVMSPLLFNLYMSFIHRNMPEGVRIVAYADDVAFYFADSDLRRVFSKLNEALLVIAKNLKLLGLEISVSKTQFCLFSGKHFNTLIKCARAMGLGLGLHGSVIECSPEVVFLGVKLDSRLTFRAHVLGIKESIGRRINVLKVLAGIRWGAHPITLLMAYRGLIRSSMDWGCQLLVDIGPALAKILDQLQYAALRVALGVMCTTPTNVILHLSRECTLNSRRRMLTCKYVAKCGIIRCLRDGAIFSRRGTRLLATWNFLCRKCS